MIQSRIRRPLLVFVLGMTLVSASASAASPAWGIGEDLGRSAWRWLAGALGQTIGIKLCCTIDPNGLCSTPKAGCTIDPAGRQVCTSAPAPKLGCSIDPDGSPRCTP